MPSPLSGAGAEMAAIRTLALVGPAAAGKTSLAEALLRPGGRHRRAGQRWSAAAPSATTIRSSGACSIRSTPSVMHLHARRHAHPLHRHARRAPTSSARACRRWRRSRPRRWSSTPPTGIEPMAVRMMEYAASRHLDRMIIVNKIDAQGVDLRGACWRRSRPPSARECLPLNLPDAGGSEGGRLLLQPRRAQPTSAAVDAAHRALVEQVVEVDAAFVDRYLERRRRRRRASCTRRSSRRCAKAT